MLTPNHVHKAKVLDVHDGDTFKALVRLDFFVRAEIDVRLHDYSAPELGQPDAGTALDMLKVLVAEREVVIQSVFSERVTAIQEEGTRSFTRWVCDVWVDGLLVNDWMRTHAPRGGIGT
jgi:hypothetical protein